MPRENRKRGEKNKAQRIDQTRDNDDNEHPNQLPHEKEQPGFPEDSPFGVLDPDVKAYFRTVDDQLRDWQENSPYVDIPADVDPNEERRMFFTAALSEMNCKELQLATDPDSSSVLERMLYSMDDFLRRVFTDSFAGSWLQLFTNRFASHVCETLFTVAVDTVAREARGIFPSAPTSTDSKGELLTMTQLILNMCEDIIPELPGLIQNPFASHVLRTLLLLLSPSDLTLSRSRNHRHAPFLRSKKSASWKLRRGPMKAIIKNDSQPDDVAGANTAVPRTPDGFKNMARRFVDKIRSELNGNEIRALGADKVASPTLQMFIELEASAGKADIPDSIMDRVLIGLITNIHLAVSSSVSPYVNALLLDATSSHLLESVFSCCSNGVFERLWDCCICHELPKLTIHPVANFVLAQGVRRLDRQRLGVAVTKLKSVWSQSLRLSRLGVLTAMIERAGQISAYESELLEVGDVSRRFHLIYSLFSFNTGLSDFQATYSMVELGTNEERKALVPCILRLKPYKQYRDELARNEVMTGGDHDAPDLIQVSTRKEPHDSVLEPKVQGSILLQSLLRLHEPYNHMVFESLHSLVPDEQVALAQNATSSRLFDVAFESATIPLRFRKQLVTAFMGRFHLLVDDRIGSRVADRCWEAADPYLKEKIARSLIPHEQFLAGSHFGRFFTRSVNLPLLQRKPDQWRAQQSKSLVTEANSISIPQGKLSHPSAGERPTASVLPSHSKHASKRKKKSDGDGDEIDLLFNSIGKNKRARGMETQKGAAISFENRDATLDAVLGAIRAAPSESRRR